ncbi:MAG: YihY/virulence factor BrkB family protein [Burkholderiales bacterium]|nr:YihY/virulence factor BrkB family protein [Burkholderiales bacterium]
MYLRRLRHVLSKAGTAWIDDHAQSMGAALSYYTVFSLAPLLLIAISVAGLAFGREAAQGAVVDQLQGLIGQQGARAIQDLLRNVSRPSEGVIATVTGVVVLVIGATSVFAELQDDLNRIWQVSTPRRVSTWWAWLRTRILSIGLILAMGFLLLVSLAASAAFDAFAAWSTSPIAAWEPLVHGINLALSFALTTALFALIYRFMPQATIEWRDVGIGALVTAALFAIGKTLIGLYIGKSALASGFGAAGSLAVLLAWVYYSAQIFLFGAEFTWAYAHAFGSHQERPAAAPADAAARPAVRFR